MKSYFFPFLRMLARLGILGLAGCVDPYLPAVVDAPTKLLVVDGFINGNGRSIFKLSRTADVASAAMPGVEKGATVFIADETGRQYPLPELGGVSGTYRSDSLLLSPAHQYQLRITTNNVSYASALVPLKVTPAIDKLGWKLQDNQVNLQINTHDANQQSRYYRWNFVETWEFHAAYDSHVEYFPHPAPGQATFDIRITPIFTCWRTETSTTIKQGSTAQLSQDVLTDFDLLGISTRAERLKIRYSVLVKQYAETAEEFAYYELLRKNTEAVGTVNDPLPVQLTGNVHRVDKASEPVLGFVGAHTVQTQRLFIDHKELPFLNEWEYITPYQDCNLGTEYICDLNGVCDYNGLIRAVTVGGGVFIDPVQNAATGQEGYSIATVACADCRTRGSNVKPSFW